MAQTRGYPLTDDAANTTVLETIASADGVWTATAGNTNNSSVAGPGGLHTKALDFDGNGDYVQLPANFDLNDTWTVAWRCRIDNTAKTNVVYGFGANNFHRMELFDSTTNGFRFVQNLTATDLASGNVSYDSNWHSYVLSCSSNNLTLYQDGSSIGTGTKATGTSSYRRIGGTALTAAADFFEGPMCDFETHDDAKDSTWAAAYHAEQTGGGGLDLAIAAYHYNQLARV